MPSRVIIVFFFAATLFAFGQDTPQEPAPAQETPPPPRVSIASSPVGRWQTVDDVTGKPKSIVNLFEQNDKLFARIKEILDPDPNNPKQLCIHCEGELKNKPEVGLRIMWDMKPDINNQWSGGKILDPHSGKTYRCIISLEDNGKKLKVRGYLGFSLLGRTQYWNRLE